MYLPLSHEIVQDQTEESSFARLVVPAQLAETASTGTETPSEAGKPSEFSSRNAVCDAAVGVDKAPDAIGYSRRVHERMFMPAVYRCAVFGSGHLFSAKLAEERTFPLRFRFVPGVQTDVSDLILRKLFEQRDKFL